MKLNIPDDNSVPSEELQRLHRGWIERGDCTPLSAYIQRSSEK